jgi:hypothetical protein
MSGENKEERTLNKGIAGEERSSSEPELTRVAGQGRVPDPYGRTRLPADPNSKAGDRF